jgi:hypothetical protein
LRTLRPDRDNGQDIEQCAPAAETVRRHIFAAQCGLLASRAGAGLPIDLRSLQNLVLVFFEEMAA